MGAAAIEHGRSNRSLQTSPGFSRVIGSVAAGFVRQLHGRGCTAAQSRIVRFGDFSHAILGAGAQPSGAQTRPRFTRTRPRARRLNVWKGHDAGGYADISEALSVLLAAVFRRSEHASPGAQVWAWNSAPLTDRNTLSRTSSGSCDESLGISDTNARNAASRAKLSGHLQRPLVRCVSRF